MSTGKFGRYEIKGEIGRGGMATVFHAYDPRFERDVAIKVLPKEFLHDPQFRARFEREAKTIALLEHHAIVPVYDFGEEEGQPFIVMRYMSGGSLSDRVKQGALSYKEVVELFTRLAPALDAAHAKGIIHRDLKPGNILYDQYGNAFLSDFGIARLAQAGGATLTGGNILGTPAYMSPEQVQGDKEVDGRSDIYAMGVILYQLLTGAAPYQATTPAKVMMMHILEPVPSILNAKADLPPAIQGVIAKAMAKDRESRYATNSEMVSSLEEIFSAGTKPNKPVADSTLAAAKSAREATGIARRRVAPTSPGTAKTEVSPVGPMEAVVPPSAKPTAAPRPRAFPIWLIGGLGVAAIAVIAIVIVLIYVVGPGLGKKAQATTTAAALTAAITPQATTAVVANIETSPTGTASPEPSATEAASTPTNTAEAIIAEAPTDTAEIPTSTSTNTPTVEPTPTDTPTPPEAISIGGADKVAFFNNNDVWVVNVDGSDLKQLTKDGAQKTNLRWTPDGQSLIFITGKCVKIVQLEDARVEMITCFDTAAVLDSFEISPDGKQVAISIDHEHMYVVPYDLEKLKTVKYRRDLAPMGACKPLSPYDREYVKSVRWSADGQKIALVFAAPIGGKRVDTIRVIDVSQCYDSPPRSGVEFPGGFLTISGYDKNPTIINFGWDGYFSFALTGIVRNGGFGDLYFFNHETNSPDLRVNPIDGNCCYRDPSYSPDGRFLLFAYQEYSETNKIELYMIQIGEIGTGLKFTPIPLPEDFFSDRTESPQPVARPAP